MMDVSSVGTGQTVLLLHGGGVAGWMWTPLLEQMGSGRRFLIPDLPGHDRSAGVEYRSHQDTVGALAALIEERSDSPVSVIGFSLGGQLALLLASCRPDLVDGVVVISAQAKPTRLPTATLALLRVAAPLARSERFARLQAKELFIPPRLFPDYLRTSRLLSRRTLLRSVGENIRFTAPEGWSRFTGRALILAGARERASVKESAQLLARARSGSDIALVEGCGHGIPLQAPESLAGMLEEWLWPAQPE